MTEPFETELKLELAASDQARLNLAGLSAKAEGRAKSLISTYYDTPDQKLRKSGYSLRVRNADGRYIQTVKGEANASAGWFVRPEWEHDIARSRPVLEEAGPLGEVLGADVLRGVGRAFVTEVERKVHKVRFQGASIVIADDCGEIRAGRHAEPIREVELELERGDPRALFTLARRLGDNVPVRLGVRSKSERGYQLLNRRAKKAFKAELVELTPTDRTDAAFEKIAQSCIRQFRLNETALLESGKPESVHQARVGLRRLRSAFSIFRPMLAGDERAELLRAELRWLAVTLGDVRDVDVLIPHLSGAARNSAKEKRETLFARMIGEVDSARTRLLMLDLTEWLAFGAWRESPIDPDLTSRDIAISAAQILKSRRKKVKHRGRNLLELPDEDRHELRKDGKKLRYATEFFATLYPEEPTQTDYRHFLDKLQDLQDQLGELNDLATFPELVERLEIEGVSPPESEDKPALLEQAYKAYNELAETKPFWT